MECKYNLKEIQEEIELKILDIPVDTPEDDWCKPYFCTNFQNPFSIGRPPIVDICLKQFER